MNLLLERGQPTAKSIIGALSTDGGFICYTLERVGVEIPAGLYQVTIYRSPKRGYDVPLLNDVPGRMEIEIHIGNYPYNTDGCILVGTEHNTDVIYHSETAFKALLPAVKEAVEINEGCWITVQDYPLPLEPFPQD
jgi:hypothetical protein